MRCLPLLVITLGFLLVARVEAQKPVSVPPPPVTGQKTPAIPYWTRSSGGFVYRWTAGDLTATNRATKAVSFSVARALKNEFGKSTTGGDASTDDAGTNNHYEVSFVPRSIVGSLLSYERDDYWEGGAHPSGTESLVTVDVRKPEKPLRLTDLFPARQIRDALLKDRVVRRVLAREKITTPPTLDGLIKALAGKQFGGDDDDMYVFPERMLESFAFHHVENGKVAVRFLLPHGTEIYRFRNTQLGILLPIPARLKPAFAEASTGKGGVLMQSLQRTTKGRSSSLTLVE